MADFIGRLLGERPGLLDKKNEKTPTGNEQPIHEDLPGGCCTHATPCWLEVPGSGSRQSSLIRYFFRIGYTNGDRALPATRPMHSVPLGSPYPMEFIPCTNGIAVADTPHQGQPRGTHSHMSQGAASSALPLQILLPTLRPTEAPASFPELKVSTPTVAGSPRARAAR